MITEQETKKISPSHQEFSKLLDDDFKDRKLVENQIIQAKVIEILKKEGFYINKALKDYGKNDRCIVCTKI